MLPCHDDRRRGKSPLCPVFRGGGFGVSDGGIVMRIKTYGIPQAPYCGCKNTFVPVREPTDAELLKGITNPKSRFGKVCEKQGVKVTAVG
jgi:hypothetical protein